MASEATYDVFLSHSTHDKPQVEELARRLKAEGIKPFLDKWHLVPGESWQEALEEALGQSQTFAVFLGPKGVGPWQNEEMRDALDSRVRDKSHRVIPVLLPGASMPDEKALPRFLKRLTWVDFRDGLTDPDALHRLVSGIKGLQPGDGVAAPARRASQAIMIGVPHRNPFFTGREDLLSRLHQQLQTQGISALAQAAIYGLGGIGKTQTAIEYVHRFGVHYRFVLWVAAEQKAVIEATYLSLARELGLVEAQADLETAVRAVKAWLSREVDWLLIFDNADDPALLRSYLPPTRWGGTILLTSRAKSFTKVGIREPFRVETFEPEVAVKFLIERTGNTNRQAAAKLASELGYLPLALEQASAYIAAVGGGFAEYLARYRRQGLGLLEKGQPSTDYPKTVATTWTLSFDAVRQASPASADLLSAAAFLRPDSVPIEIFIRGGSEFGDLLAQKLKGADQDPLVFWELLEPLERYSLVERVSVHAFKLHRLTQEVVKGWLGVEGRRIWRERLIRALDAMFPDPEPDSDICSLKPNATLISELARIYPLGSPTACRLPKSTPGGIGHLSALVMKLSILIDQDLHDKSDDSLKKQSVESFDFLEDDLLNAELLGLLGFPEVSRERLSKILEIQMCLLGPVHLDTLTSREKLAKFLRTLHDLAGARKLYEQNLEIKMRVLGAEHPSTTISTWNLLLTVSELNDSAATADLLNQLRWLLDRDEGSIQSIDQRFIRQELLGLLSPP